MEGSTVLVYLHRLLPTVMVLTTVFREMYNNTVIDFYLIPVQKRMVRAVDTQYRNFVPRDHLKKSRWEVKDPISTVQKYSTTLTDCCDTTIFSPQQ